jgi:hypothetical protein
MGCTGCWHGFWGCTGICNGAQNFGCNLCAGASGRSPDIGIASIGGVAKDSNNCFSNMWFAATGAPKYGMTTRQGREHCSVGNTAVGCEYGAGGSKWPAGMGTPSSACGGGCCWGGWGAGGLVLITYGS